MYARDIRHIDSAIKVAINNSYRWKHGCVIARGNRVLISRPNKLRNLPTTCPKDATIHAEEAAIKGRYRFGR
jgi:hypothetical protein